MCNARKYLHAVASCQRTRGIGIGCAKFQRLNSALRRAHHEFKIGLNGI
jgi:hypothetical protein